MPNVMVALPNRPIGGALCSTPKKKKKKEEETTGQKYNGLPYSIGRP